MGKYSHRNLGICQTFLLITHYNKFLQVEARKHNVSTPETKDTEPNTQNGIAISRKLSKDIQESSRN